MSLLAPLIVFELRQAIAEPDDRVADWVAKRLAQPAGALGAALAFAADRTWRGLAAALAMDGVLSRLRATDAAEAAGVEEQLRRFADQPAVRFRKIPEEVRMACLAEWRRAQEKGRVGVETWGADDVARETAAHWRYEDPAGLIAAAGRAEAIVVGGLAADHPQLAKLLRERLGGPPLLASVFAYFFRREVESNENLSNDLLCDGLRHLSAPQARALAGLAQALARLGSRFDAIIDQLLAGKPRSRESTVSLVPLDAAQAGKLGRRRGLSGVVALSGPAGAREPRRPAAADMTRRPPGDALVNSLGMRFVWVPPGDFAMGSPPQEVGRDADEKPHLVRLTRGFFLGAQPVTRGQFAAFARATKYLTDAERQGGAHRGASGEWQLDPWCTWRHPDFPQDDDHPVVCVSWNDAQAFCAWLAGDKQHRDGVCRLPTEAEWEYACRAGATTAYSLGDELSTDQANYNGKAPGGTGLFRDGTTPAWVFPPSPWGLHDMHGNVWEWCADWYGPYPEADAVDPQGPAAGRNRILRGGSWRNQERFLRSAARNQLAPSGRDRDAGFRVCLFL